MIPTLESLALAAILSVTDAADEAERHRLTMIAADVALAVELGRVPFVGPAAKEAAVVALVAIGHGESMWRAEVGDCRVRGDLRISRIGSLGYWQILGPFARHGSGVEDICANDSLAAWLALRVLDIHSMQARTWGGAFLGYASGSASKPSEAGRRHCRRWETLSRRAGLEVSCWNKAAITWKDPTDGE